MAANNISRTTANLNGIVNPNHASTQYWFEYGTTASLGQTSAFTSISENTPETSIATPLSNLNPSTTYYFRLNAQNQYSTTNGTILTFKTAGPTNASTPIVSTKNATNVDSDSATLQGSVNPNGLYTNYWFEYSTDSLLGSILL